ncbi:MAG: hypothetical protein JW953_21625 [Anaerolineae bacterium]|nr:hypothetical protein [Anaerolineae bacterium]
MKTFIKPNTQVVIGNKDLPQRVVNGPCRIFLVGKRVYSQMSIIPQTLTFTSQELPTATQIPVIVQITCDWSRNLANLTDQQLYNAVNLPNEKLEPVLRQNLEIAAKRYVSSYPVDELIATPEVDKWQLTFIKHNHRHLTHCMLDEINKRLGGLGLIVNELSINITLPTYLQREMEDIWRLQKHQDHIPGLTDLKLAQAIANSQPIIKLIMGSLLEEKLDDYDMSGPIIEAASIYREGFKGNGHSKKNL